MAFFLANFTDIKALPDEDSATLDSVAGVTLPGTGKIFTTPSGDVWVNVSIPPGFVDGWVPEKACKKVDDTSALPPLNEEMFVRQCTLVDRTLNSDPAVAPFPVTADFMIARAILETGMTLRTFDPPLINGPLRMSGAEWGRFIASGLDAAKSFSEDSAVFPLAQVYGAGYRMHQDGQAFNGAWSKAVDPEPEPIVPSYLDLFHCYLTDPESAVALRRAETDATVTLSQMLGQDQLDALAKRPKLSAVQGTMSAPDFFLLTEPLLFSLLDAAFGKIKTLAPDELPASTASSPGTGTGPGSGPAGGLAAPWLDVARGQLNLKINEKKNPDVIRGYFAATDFGRVGAGAIPAWCGAFAAFCMQQVGLSDTIPENAARASRWSTWGEQNVALGSSTIPQGAVVVLTEIPTQTGPHGHVGFFDGFTPDGRGMMLIGGNQSNAVSRTSFPLSRVAAIRVGSSTAAAVGAANRFDLTAAKVNKKFQPFGDLIVERFRRAGLGTDQHLRTALANAIAESGLNPSLTNVTQKEASYGLFQCNQMGGLGQGHSKGQLLDPEANIAIVLQAARASRGFVAASTLAAAMQAFVKDVERPKNTAAEIAARTRIANKL